MSRDSFLAEYNQKIKPKLKQFENLRKVYSSIAVIAFILGYGLFIACFALSDYMERYLGKYYFLGMGCIFIFYLICGSLGSYFKIKLEQRMKNSLMQSFCDCIGRNIRWAQSSQLFMNDTALIERSRLMPPGSRIDLDDTFIGVTKNGNLYKISEVIGYGRNSNKIFIFLRFKGKNYANTVLMPKGEWQLSYNLRKTTLEDVKFNLFYDVYTDDEVEARFLLNPSLMEKLNGLKERYRAGNIGVSFFNDNLVIRLSVAGDAFELGDSVIDDAQFFRLYEEITAVLDLIEYIEN